MEPQTKKEPKVIASMFNVDKMAKYIVAEYVAIAKYKIPDEVELDKVTWWIKYNTLYIKLSDDNVLEIEPDSESETDYKYPTKTWVEEKEED